MANRLACEVPEMFAGVATFAGSTWSDPERCAPPPGAATNILNIHGDADVTVPVGGGVNFVGTAFPSQDITVDTFARKFGCVPRAAAITSGDFTIPASPGSPTG
jgi:poly(3-hydroxybutyrate) depolymerase